jgi:hypothetical protein
MSKNLNDDVLLLMGGLRDFKKTVIYPNKLRIASLKYDHVWRIKIKDEIQLGVLRIRIAVFNYVLDEKGLNSGSNRQCSSDWDG